MVMPLSTVMASSSSSSLSSSSSSLPKFKIIKLPKCLCLNERMLMSMHQYRYMRWYKTNDEHLSCKINSIDWLTPNGDHLITSSDDGFIRIYDLNGTEISMIPSLKYGCVLVQFKLNGDAAIHASKFEGIDINYHKIRHLDIKLRRFTHYYNGHNQQVTSLAINHNYSCFISSSIDRTVRLWDDRMGLTNKEGDRLSFAKVEVNARPFANFDPHGIIFGVGTNNDSIRLYDMRNYSKGPFKVAKYPESRADGEWQQLKFSPDGSYISISTTGTRAPIIDAYTLQDVSALTDIRNDCKINLENSWSVDSQYLFCGSSVSFLSSIPKPGDVRLNMFRVRDGQKINFWPSLHENPIYCVRFNPRYCFIATACHDVSIWQPKVEQINAITNV